MEKTTEQDFRLHAEQEYPRESCGLIAIVKGREKYFPCENQAKGTEHFTLSAEDYADVEEQGEIVAVCHSHPNALAVPSQADKVSCEASRMPWHIVSVQLVGDCPKSTTISMTEPSGYTAPLVGRVFAHGVLDCYAIVRDWYMQERSIELLNFKRADDWWTDGHSDLYTEGFPKAGFQKIGNSAHDCKMEIGDVILMQVRSKNHVPNHAAIYLGDGLMLHHLYGRLSSRDVYGGMYQDYTRAILRYKG